MLTQRECFMNNTFVDLLRLRATETPSKQAYTYLRDGETDEVRLDYAELDRQARRIAAWLRSHAGGGERALLLYPPGLDYIAGFFGCLYAGVVAVPAYPPQRKRILPRLQAMVEDCSPAFVLTTTEIRQKIEQLSGKHSDLEQLRRLPWLETDAMPPGNEDRWQPPDINGHTLAFLQYTSGSTGRPKGVMVSHANLLHNERMIQQAFGHGTEEVIVGWLPLYHDMGLIGNLLQPLYVGAPCILMSPSHFLQKPVRWLEAISRYRATTSGGPNFAYDLCAREISPDEAARLDLRSWSVAFNGAEPIQAGTLKRFTETFEKSGFRAESFYPCYGAAEGTLLMTGGHKATAPVLRSVQKSALHSHRVIDAEDATEDAQVLVGCGMPHLDQRLIIVRPESRTPCVEGEVGEIWIQGVSIAQGYWKRPDETKAVFKATLAESQDGPFLRTGDLGFVQGGETFVTGRLKDLIIIRGRNHYPHDIELTAEQSHPSLRQTGAAAFSVEVEEEERLVLVQELTSRRCPEPEAVVASIRRNIAECHDLHAFAVLLIKPGSLPKTSSGKVQRRLCREKFLANELDVVEQSLSLAVPPSPLCEGEEELGELPPVPEWGDTERLVAESWSQVLRRTSIGRTDNFFAMGGDSLRGTQVIARLRDTCRIELPLDTLFDHPTVPELAAHIEATRATMPMKASPSITSRDRRGVLPLSFAQERFWFLEQLSPGSVFNNIPIALRISGTLNVAALHRAFNEIVRRHEILRVSFALVDSRPAQVVAPSLEIPLVVEDLSSIPEETRDAHVQRLVTDEARRPFDLVKAPLIRTRLFRVGAQEHVLTLTIHHIVTDGRSMEIFSRELALLYEAFVDGRMSPLPDLSIQYLDVVMHQRQSSHESELQRQATYWRQQLEHVPDRLSLPYDYSRPEVQGYRGGRHGWTVNAEIMQGLHAIGHRNQTTLFMTLLAAFKLLLHRYSGQNEFCIGTPVANRNAVECEQLIGCFVNTVALRADLAGNPSFPELLRRVRGTVLGAQASQDIPFEKLIEELGVPRDLGYTPLFQVMLVLEESPSDRLMLGDLEMHRIKVDTHTSLFDLTLELAAKADGSLEGWFEYSAELFADHTIVSLADHFQVLLKNIVSQPEARISELSLLTVKERGSLVTECNQTDLPSPEGLCLHQLFEAQTEKTPEAVALESEGRSYTFSFVNGRANQLARYLRQEGVGAETPVGLCMDRSLEMVVGLLGALKAGAVYVPIDPSYPVERQAVIIQDVRPRLLLTRERLAGTLSDHAIPLVILDRQWEIMAGFSSANLRPLTNPDHLAYILYTSGSTGRPKGTGISHRAIVNHSTAMVSRYELCSSDRVLQFASVSFDVAIEECFPTWNAGARVVLRPNEPVPAFSDLRQFISDHGLTVLNLPTPYWAEWIEDIERTALPVPDSVRLVVVGSEKAMPDAFVRWQRVTGNRVRWCNSYGPTETTITASTYMPGGKEDWSRLVTVPIGRPIANAQLYVLDSYCEPVPLGVPGELYIGGLGLARGYEHLPALTAEKFVPNPFSQDPGRRLYRSGDRVRRRLDGNVEFLSRQDEQVKIRGFRVEPSEIEFHVRQHPAVIEARIFLESSAPRDWSALIGGRTDEEQERILTDIESLTAAEAQWIYDLESDAEERRKTVIQRKPEFDLYLKINKEEFVSPPKANQRNWLLRRALDEFSDDLCELDAISKRFVSGSDRTTIERTWAGSRAEYKPSELIIEGQQVMQDWEAPLMKAMADIATESRGDVLEVGFGMGISASYIQAGSPRSHTIIECNREVMAAFAEWKNRYPDRDIRLVEGRWQEVVETLSGFDGIFFDTYPVSEEEFEESVLNSINFAEAFIPAAAKMLRPGGVFTYYTNEIDSFSRRHQRFLFQHFSSFTLSVVRSLLPPEDCHYWWADSMAVVKAVK